MRLPALVTALLFAPAVLVAQSSPQHGADASVGLRFGTLGLGAEVNKLLLGHVGVRLGANFFNYNTTRLQSDVTFDATLKLKAITGLVDLYPVARRGFHFTVGFATNPVEVTGVAKPTGSTFDIDNVTYTRGQVGVFNGSGKYSSVLPYVGLGFGTSANSHHGVKFVFDICGAIGTPTVLLSASNPMGNTALAQSVREQQVKTQTDINKYAKIYPAITFGLAYVF